MVLSVSSQGTVSGVLLVTPNNIMFDPHKTDPLVQENGCEEYGIMCPMEEVMSAAMYKEILDSKIKESLPMCVCHCTGWQLGFTLFFFFVLLVGWDFFYIYLYS